MLSHGGTIFVTVPFIQQTWFLASYLCNPLYTGKPLRGTLENSEDPDEMPQNVAFHQYSLLRKLQSPLFPKKITIFREELGTPMFDKNITIFREE